jgi:adenosine kinase
LIPEIAQHLAQIPRISTSSSKHPRTVIITQGTLPTVVSSGTASIDLFSVTPIPSSEINDTNGAGDAFAGGFVSGIVEGKGLSECIERGHWLAGLSVRELGPSFPMPKQTFHGTS